MTVRSELAAAIADLLPANYRVVGYAKALDRVDKGRPVVMIYRASVAPSSLAFQALDNEMIVWVIHPELTPGEVDDALDDSLDAVLAAIDLSQLTTWQRAERTAFDDTFPGYRITCQTTSSKEM